MKIERTRAPKTKDAELNKKKKMKIRKGKGNHFEFGTWKTGSILAA